jgi:hypothetical protein
MNTQILKQCCENKTTIHIKAKCNNCGNEYYSEEFEDDKDYQKDLKTEYTFI